MLTAPGPGVSDRPFSGGAQRRSLVRQVSRDERAALVAIAAIENVDDGVDLKCRPLRGSQIVEQQQFGLKDRLQHAHFGGIDGRIVGFANVPDQFTIVTEEGRYGLASHQFLEDSDREVGLAAANAAHQEQAFVYNRIFLDELPRGQPCRNQRAIVDTIKLGNKGVQFVGLITFGNVCGFEQAGGSLLLAALTA